MALEIFKLVGSIFIDNEKANDSLQKTDKKANNLANTMGNAGTYTTYYKVVRAGYTTVIVTVVPLTLTVATVVLFEDTLNVPP